jgi:hypothetical protein
LSSNRTANGLRSRRGARYHHWPFRDSATFIELLASPEVGTYLGGPRPRDEFEREMPGAPERRPGLFIVDLDGAMIGQVILRRATGHGAGEAELGYLFLPEACRPAPR